MAETQRYGIQAEIPVEGTKAYVYNKNEREPRGYIKKWKFASGTELAADTKIPDPENPTKEIEVVAILDGLIYWLGGPTDPLLLPGRLSTANKATLNQAVNSLNAGAEQEVEFVVCDYDDTANGYFKSFFSESAIKVVTTPTTQVRVNPLAHADVTEPRNFGYTVSFTAQGKAGKQNLTRAEAPGKNEVKQFGGIG
jgi:hypothetical protein